MSDSWGITPSYQGLAASVHTRPRASLYVRLSHESDEKNLSLRGMIDDLRGMCVDYGFEEVALHVDDGRSGGNRDRSGYRDWLNDAHTGLANVLLAHSVSRVTREGINGAAPIMDAIEGKDPKTGRMVHAPVRFIEYARKLDSAHEGAFRIQFAIEAEMARDMRKAAARQSADKDRRLRVIPERFTGGTAPYGYYIAPVDPDWVPEPGALSKRPPTTLRVQPEEATAIRTVARRILSEYADIIAAQDAGRPNPGRVNLLAACRWMDENAPPARRSKDGRWRRSSLLKVLTGFAVCGYKPMSAHLPKDELGRPIGQDVLRDSTGMPVQAFEPILTPAESAGLRAALAAKPRTGGETSTRESEYLLTHLLWCAYCDHVLVPNEQDSGKTRPRTLVYRCLAVAQNRPCPFPVTVTGRHVEAYISDLYLDRFGRLPYTEKKLVVMTDTGRDTVEAAIAALTEKLRGELSAEQEEAYWRRLQALKADRRRLAEQGDPRPTLEDVPTGRTRAQEWERQDVAGRRAILARDWPEKIRIRRTATWGSKRFDTSRVLLNLDDRDLYPAPAVAWQEATV